MTEIDAAVTAAVAPFVGGLVINLDHHRQLWLRLGELGNLYPYDYRAVSW